ncbi:hypothetical protein TWF281_003180 [Arthrobotrys megalospora]
MAAQLSSSPSTAPVPRPSRRSIPVASMSTMPPEILEDILLYKKPIFLLTTCRLVCKSWNSIITSTPGPLKYFSTTGLDPRDTTERAKRSRYVPKPDVFTPLFLNILYRFWKRAAPLAIEYQEPTGDNVSDKDREKVSAELATEIELLYHRYNPIFSIVPFLNPVYYNFKCRISFQNWGIIKSRSRILDEADGLWEGIERGPEEYIPPNLLPFLKFTDVPLFQRPNWVSIWLCRFVFYHVPANSYKSGYEGKIEDVQSWVRFGVTCTAVGKDTDATAEARNLMLPNFRDFVPEVHYI